MAEDKQVKVVYDKVKGQKTLLEILGLAAQ